MTIPSHSRTAFAIGFWVYGVILLMATHAPAKDVQFLARAAENGLLDPDKLLHLVAYAVLGLLAGLAYGGRWHNTSTVGMRRESAPHPACRAAAGIAQGSEKQAQVHKQPVRTYAR